MGFRLLVLKGLKTLIKHVSRNVLLFPKHRYLCKYLIDFIGKKIKKLNLFVFGNIILFFHKGCFACVLAFWYVRSSKTLQGKFLVKVGFILM